MTILTYYNFQDPHEELKEKNVLIVQGSIEKTAEKFGIDARVVESVLQKCRQVLFAERLRRPKPHLDDKMVAAWNGRLGQNIIPLGRKHLFGQLSVYMDQQKSSWEKNQFKYLKYS